ncbi:MAG: ATP-binding protein [Acidimicrobiales bacterium]
MQPGSWPTADPLLGEEPRRLERTITTLDELAALRATIRGWLAGRPLPDEALEDLLLGVSEASMNAVEHGTPPGGRATVRVDDAGDHVHVAVHDQGRWIRPVLPVGDGYGLAIIDGVSEGSLRVRPSMAGTEVSFDVPSHRLA